MTRISISELNPKDEIRSTFCIKYIALMESKDGKKYLNLILMDKTGDLEARVWNDASDVFNRVEKNDFVEVSGKVNVYQGRKQFVINAIDKLDAKSVDLNDFMVRSENNTDEMYLELVGIVDNLTDVYIKKLLKNILSDSEIERRLKIWQAGKSIHHAYTGGLLEHILSCASLAVELSPKYHCNVNYVVAGAVLHDICKIYELSDGMNVDYTEEGKLVGHLVKALEVVDRFSYRIENFPYHLKLHLKHILLSHHGEYEFGSPKIPQTSEAMLVHLIDLMDSKMNTFKAIKKMDNNVGHWSSFVKHLDRIVFKDELPFYPHFEDASSRVEKTEKPKTQPKNRFEDKELKQNLGSVLQNFKIQKD